MSWLWNSLMALLAALLVIALFALATDIESDHLTVIYFIVFYGVLNNITINQNR